MNSITADGIMCSFGVIYIQLLKEFNEGKGYTSWILSLMSGMALCAGKFNYSQQQQFNIEYYLDKLIVNYVGPISSSFVDKFGFRAVTIAGAILAAISLVVSSYAQNIFTLIITIGKENLNTSKLLSQLTSFLFICKGFGLGCGLGFVYLPVCYFKTQYH